MKIPQVQHITIVGLGVIGGSLALALKKTSPRLIITGFDSTNVHRKLAHDGIIDRAAENLHDAVRSADVIFLCVPVRTTLQLLKTIAPTVKKDAIITDVGSTKKLICTTAAGLFTQKGVFIGGHPMAGSEGSGFQHADPLLFQNAVYVLCPGKGRRRSFELLSGLLTAIGARVFRMDAVLHDRVAASVSHLPQLLAVALMNFVAAKNKHHDAFLALAAGGFRDMTRIASSPYGMWGDILSTNTTEVQASVNGLVTILQSYSRFLRSRSIVSFKKEFFHSKKTRDTIPKFSKGFLRPQYDVLVWISDKPGALATITARLAKEEINIHDVELLKIREGEAGTFRFSFATRGDAQRAVRCLRRVKIQAAVQ